MGDSVFVDVLEQVDHLRDVKYLDVLVEFVDIGFDEIDELPSLAVLEHKVEALLILEGRAQFDDSGVFEVRQEFFFDHSLILLLFSLQLLLLYLLHRVGLFIAIFDNKKNISVGSLAQSILKGEIFWSERDFPFGSAGFFLLGCLHLEDIV